MTINARDKSLSLRRDLADAIPVLKQESNYAIYEAYSVVQVYTYIHISMLVSTAVNVFLATKSFLGDELSKNAINMSSMRPTE